MTDDTQIVPIQRSSHYPASEAQALAAEVAKCLKLVASASMNAEQQTVWLHAAVDALEDIRADEVAHVSAEVRRSVTRPAQIIPEIAKLVAARRAERANSSRIANLPTMAEPPPRPIPPPMTAAEIAKMPKWLKDMGVRVGWLKRENGALVEA